MAEMEATLVTELLGWKKTDDGRHALIGFKDANGAESALAVSKSDLPNLLLLAMDAQSLLPLSKGMKTKTTKVASVEWFEFANNLDTGNFVLTFYRSGGGHISFDIPQGMAVKLRETLNLALGEEPTLPSNKKSVN